MNNANWKDTASCNNVQCSSSSKRSVGVNKLAKHYVQLSDMRWVFARGSSYRDRAWAKCVLQRPKLNLQKAWTAVSGLDYLSTDKVLGWINLKFYVWLIFSWYSAFCDHATQQQYDQSKKKKLGFSEKCWKETECMLFSIKEWNRLYFSVNVSCTVTERRPEKGN